MTHLEMWDRAVRHLAKGHRPDRDDYLNDLDIRESLTRLDLNPGQAQALAMTEKIFHAHTFETDDCVWGNANAEEKGWTKEKNPWYFRVPKQGFTS